MNKKTLYNVFAASAAAQAFLAAAAFFILPLLNVHIIMIRGNTYFGTLCENLFGQRSFGGEAYRFVVARIGLIGAALCVLASLAFNVAASLKKSVPLTCAALVSPLLGVVFYLTVCVFYMGREPSLSNIFFHVGFGAVLFYVFSILSAAASAVKLAFARE